ncbi:MAG: cytochrome c, partial [Planctomycetaceae bacterium]|nr:cytochrome c [Planctomycetaceae bacterium]
GIAVIGCGKNDPQQVETSSPPEARGSADVDAPRKSESAAGKHGRDEVYVDENGQKWFGNVPWDVFPEDAYAVAANQTPVGGAATVPPLMTSNGEEPVVTSNDNVGTEPTPAMDSPTGSSAAGGTDWAELISAQTLDDEVKAIRTFLLQGVSTVGEYNNSMLSIPPRAATLAALAGIAMEHSEDVSWREDAPLIRELAREMNASSLQRGAKDQKRLQELVEPMSEILNRSKPAGLPEPNMENTFAEVAEMRLVMKRMETAETRMRNEAGSEGAFTSNAAIVRHEAAVLGTLARVVIQPGYGYEDDPKFVGYANEVTSAAKTIMEAADAGNFAAYDESITKFKVACDRCHSDFKND